MTQNGSTTHKYKYDRVGFICRAQPPHIGHVESAVTAAEYGETVIILVGSARTSRRLSNPFSYSERVGMLQEAIRERVGESEMSRFIFRPLRDDVYNNERWLGRVQDIMTNPNVPVGDGNKVAPSIAIISSDKDGDDLLRAEWFPFWDTISIPHKIDLHAKDIRGHLYETEGDVDSLVSKYGEYIPPSVITRLRELMTAADDTPNTFQNRIHEYKVIQKYKAPSVVARVACEAADLPWYPRIEHTGDAVVICNGHVLLVKRKYHPGKGMYALPGGYMQSSDATSLDTAVRELYEETKIDVPPAIIESALFDTRSFNHVSRDERGRVCTDAFAFRLRHRAKSAKGDAVRSEGGMPKVSASDDAEWAGWIPLSMFREGSNDIEPMMFADHYAIVNYFIGRLDSAAYK